MSAAATRDDLASVVAALTDEATLQDSIQAKYTERTAVAAAMDPPDRIGEALWEKYAYGARSSALAFTISADMISKYVGVTE